MDILRFSNLEGYGDKILHGLSTRKGGVSEGHFASLNLGFRVGDSFENVEENYRRLLGCLGGDFGRFVVANQEHSDKVVYVDERANFGLSGVYEEVDGFITDKVGISLLVRFADCQGVLFFDPVSKVIAAVHCGWRGNVSNILGKTVGRMVSEFGCDASNIIVGVSPSLGPCCAEFTEPLRELPEFMHEFVTGRHVDLWEVSRMQLMEAGVMEENIEFAGRCTKCEKDVLFSYRGGGKKTGHMGAVICLR